MFRTILDTTPIPTIIVQDKQITYMNSLALQTFNIDSSEETIPSEEILSIINAAYLTLSSVKYKIHKREVEDQIVYQLVVAHSSKSNLVHLYETILNKMEKGIFITDLEDNIVFCNEAGMKIDALNHSTISNAKRKDFYKCDKEDCPRKNALITGQSTENYLCEYCVYDGKEKKIAVNIYPHHIGSKLEYVYTIYQDSSIAKDNIAFNSKQYNDLIKSHQVKEFATIQDLIGSEMHFAQAKKLAEKVAKNISSIMIYGKTGTGKELFAQGIHAQSLYSTGPFISINCAAVPDTLMESIFFGSVKGAFSGAENLPGLFEQAQNGTLFLDEINSMNILLQAKLLRVIQEKKVTRLGSQKEMNVNCRIICSINKDPQDCVEKGIIREDLFYRLSTVILEIPPLKERKADIEDLIHHFIKKYNKNFGASIAIISPDLKTSLLHYDYPGNVRELQHIIESAFNLVNPDEVILKQEHLPRYLMKRLLKSAATNTHDLENSKGQPMKLDEVGKNSQKELIIESLKRNGFNISKAARELGVSRQTLQYRMKKYDIKVAK